MVRSVSHLLGDKRIFSSWPASVLDAHMRCVVLAAAGSVADFCLFRAGCARIRGFKDEISLPFATVRN